MEKKKLECPECGEKEFSAMGGFLGVIEGDDVGINVHVYRITCSNCGTETAGELKQMLGSIVENKVDMFDFVDTREEMQPEFIHSVRAMGGQFNP